MSRFLNNLKKDVVLFSILYIIVGAIFLFYPEMSANIIAYILGGTIIAFGISKLIVYRKYSELVFGGRLDLLIGAVALGVGIFIVFNPKIVISILPFIAGIFMIIEALSLLQNTGKLKEHKNKYNTSLVLAVVLLIGGIIVLINPFKTATTILMFIGIFFIYDGVCQLWSVYQVSKAIKNTVIEIK